MRAGHVRTLPVARQGTTGLISNADEALAEARQLLEAASVPYRVHMEIGDKARRIADAARFLRCDRIVVGSARKSALVRAAENSLTGRLLERCMVLVEVIGRPPVALAA